ncbi:MAG: hypothetical protein COB85_07705 [Bacteroidetes bacterium]|nr:MAG: hypothetical protein COB85_07705 [Bacteroidota bacterium]
MKTAKILLSFVLALAITFSNNLTAIAQTGAQITQIQSNSNITVLNQLAANFSATAAQEKTAAEAWATSNGYPIRGLTADGSVFEIIRLDANGMPQYYVTNNINAANTISTNEIWSGSGASLTLDGTGYTLGLWDEAQVQGTHVEFGTRATQGSTDGATAESFHATHVAGTMIAAGTDASARGMANAADLTYWDWTADISEVTTEAAGGLLFSNHSYGWVVGWARGDFGAGFGWYWFGDLALSTAEDDDFGFYDNSSRQLDLIANNAPNYLMVRSAGNDRGQGPASGSTHFHWDAVAGDWESDTDDHALDGQFDCLPQNAVAKNILVVGAIDDIPSGYSVSTDVVQTNTSFSSWGPADDGRIKPDIVANGDCLYSTWEGTDRNGCDGNSCNGLDYCTISGTSMAAPSVTGSLALLQEHYSNTNSSALMLASTLKALVIHTADDAGTGGPDYQFGWGLMNTGTATEIINNDFTFSDIIQELTLDNASSVSLPFYYDGSEPSFRATLVWNDPAGTPVAASLDPADAMLVNDLDMVITAVSGGTTFFPYSLDPANPANAATATGDNSVDNVEQVQINSAQIGDYIVTITHKATLAGGNSQDFSIIIGPTGIVVGTGDVVEVTGPSTFSPSKGTGTSVFSPITYNAQFTDFYGTNFVVSWLWDIRLLHSSGFYDLKANTSGSQSDAGDFSSYTINSAFTLPNLDWTIDGNGNIVGVVLGRSEDDQGSFNSDSKIIGVTQPPQKPAIDIEQLSCTSVKLIYASAGASSYEIYYGTSSGVYTGTGITQGNSPINTGTATSITLTGLTSGQLYYFAVKGVNTEGSSGFSDEVDNLVYDIETFTATSSATWEPGAANNPFGSTTGEVVIGQYVSIPEGINITIKDMTFKFGNDAEFVVEQGTTTTGGKLTLDNTTFTSDDQCGVTMMWRGIQVWGNPSESQLPLGNTKQGWVTFRNNSVVENARVGVLAGRSGVNYGGGIIHGISSTFENNGTGVAFFPYDNFIPTNGNLFRNLSSLTLCTLDITGPLNDPNETGVFGLRPLVLMVFVDGIYTRGNMFRNSAPGSSVPERGTGILSLSSRLNVTPSGTTPNTFENLYYGIIASSFFNPLDNVYIDRNVFTNTYRGILLGQADYSTVTRNTFALADWSNTVPSTTNALNYPFGLYLYGCTGYKVEENNFNHPATYNFNMGIIDFESGNNYNEIYNNTFTNIWYSLIAYNDNDGPNQYDGLEILCNNFENDLNDVAVYFGDIGDHQGRCSGPFVLDAPAGNQFSHTCQQTGIDHEYDVNKPSAQLIIYAHHEESYSTAPNDRTQPQCYNSTYVDLSNCAIGYDIDESCPSSFAAPCDIPCVLTAISDFEIQIQGLEEKKDGGDTQALLALINQDASPGKVKNAYLAASPYVSDLALIAAINNKSTPLPPGILKEIIMANSRVSDDVRYALLNRNPALPKGVRNQINSVQTGTSPFEELELDIAFIAAKRENKINDLIRQYLLEDNLSEALDKVLSILKQEQRPMVDKCRIVAAHVRKGELAEAQLEIAVLHPDGILDNFCKLQEIAIELKQQQETVYDIAQNPVQEAKVRAIAADLSEKTMISARNILALAFEEPHQEFIKFPSQQNKMDPNYFEKNNELLEKTVWLDENHTLSSFPNPFKHYATIEAYIPEESNSGEIVVYNLLGVEIKRYELVQGYNVLTVYNEDLPRDGMYLYTLIVDGSVLEKKRMVFVK